MVYKNLRRLAEAAKGAALREFRALVAIATAAQDNERQLVAVKAALNGHGGVAANETEKPRKRAKQRVKLPPTELLKLQIAQIRAVASGDGGQIERADLAVAERLGVASRKNWRRIAGGIYAQTSGMFRGRFIAGVLANQKPNQARKTLRELTRLFSQIDEKQIAPAMLSRSAKRHSKSAN